MTAVLDRPTALYRFYDANGALFYVGITYDPTVRFYHHATYKPWWPQVTRREVVWYDTRDEAGAAEAKAIIEESPLWNIATPDENGRYQAGGGRPLWDAATDEQRAALDAIDKAVEAANQIRARAEEAKVKAEAEADNVVAAAIEAARQLGVPVRAAVKRTGVSRATIYRRLGKDTR